MTSTSQQYGSCAACGTGADDQYVDLIQFYVAQPQPVPQPWKSA